MSLRTRDIQGGKGAQVLKFLCRVGLIRKDGDRIVWPIHVAPAHWWWFLLRRADGRVFKRTGVFRNRPNVVKWMPGRFLPRRWGFFVLGLEIGDRGG